MEELLGIPRPPKSLLLDLSDTLGHILLTDA